MFRSHAPSTLKSVHTGGKTSLPGTAAVNAALASVVASKGSFGDSLSPEAQKRSHGRQLSKEQRDFNNTLKELKQQAKLDKKNEKLNSKKIDEMLHEQMLAEKKIVKILLLGPGESGKSTLFKQIRKNYGSPPDEVERRKHHIIVIQNVVRSIKSLIYHSERLLQRLPFSALNNTTKASTTTIDPVLNESKKYIEALNLYKLFEGKAEMPSDINEITQASLPEANTNNAKALEKLTGVAAQQPPAEVNLSINAASMLAAGVPVVKLNPSGKFVPQILTVGADGRPATEIFQEILTHCFLLWNDPGLKVTFENRAHFDFHQLFDSDSYFLHKLATGILLQDDYFPSDEDLIRVRIRTTCISSIDFKMKVNDSDADSEAVPMRMLDVAGQRSERKKWIPYFQDATAVIFVAGISEYDQVLCEDGQTNRLMEAIHLFTEIMNSNWFVNTPIVLFLNKCDLFAEKIKRVPLNILFPKYSGSTTYQTACEFLCREFVKRRNNQNKVIHIHVVSAIQIDLIKTAMDSVKQMLIESSLGYAGLMQ